MTQQTVLLAITNLLLKKGIFTEGEILSEMDQMDEEIHRRNPTLKAVECLMEGDIKGFLGTMKEKKNVSGNKEDKS